MVRMRGWGECEGECEGEGECKGECQVRRESESVTGGEDSGGEDEGMVSACTHARVRARACVRAR